MICGIVDVGSNTIRLSLYRCENGTTQLLMHRKVMAGLAGYVEDGRLSAEGIRIMCRVLSEYRTLLDNLGVGPMYAFATASLRNVSNTEEAVQEVLKRTGLTVDVISGEEEAALSFRGALQDITHDSGLMVDLGGGSAELLEYRDRQVLSACSLPIGALNLFHRYVSRLRPTEKECKAIRNEVREQLARCGADLHPAEHICGVGGTVRAVCKVANHIWDRPESCRVLTAGEWKELVKKLRKMDNETTRDVLKVVPDRIHTIVPGILVLDTLRQVCGAKDITASACGVREGYLHSRVLGEDHNEQGN